MTPLRPATRRLPASIDRREWAVTLDNVGVTLRQLRTRKALPTVAWNSVYDLACKLAANEKRGAKKEGRL